MEAGKSVFYVLSDNRPDFNLRSLINAFFYYRLFRHLKLDLLFILTYAAKYSAYNSIEHVWSPLSNALFEVTLSSCLPEDNKPPSKQSGLSREELAVKVKKLFDIAMEECANHWRDATFDEFPINVNVIKCSNNILLFDHYVKVKEFLKYLLRQAHEFSGLQNKFQAMFKHVDWYSNEVVFTKCSNVDCCDNCKALDVQSFLNRHNVKQFAPVNSASLSGHYETFLNLSMMESGFKYCDEGQPSRDKKTLFACKFCPSFTIFSKTEKD